ncbi:hypothetical protein ISX50_12115 [Vibrio cyclitrophicus]|nr:hypothetical protein [Vibrio cyclitrophicus]UPR33821.1 hypothetical protein ISX50_12115 [Vibrio cyclitrophicus]
MTLCSQQHRYDPSFELLPEDQSHFNGRHKCSGCAYERGYDIGKNRAQSITIDFSTLPDSQAGTVRHKSVQAAFANGYRDGILASYES